jgi:pyridoxal phosphate enzyme (YggS family)
VSKIDEVILRIEQARLGVDAKQIVKIVAVSKYSTSAQIKLLYGDGQRAFGENKVQDLINKANELDELPFEWHFIGRLQTNKINALLKLNPALIQSIDSFEMALEINKRATGQVNALLQINSAFEESKAGVHSDDAIETYAKISELANINLQGVMSIGAHTDDVVVVQKSFETTRKIFDSLSSFNPKYCSMGMSGDFELAIECGSNMLRLGSILF